MKYVQMLNVRLTLQKIQSVLILEVFRLSNTLKTLIVSFLNILCISSLKPGTNLNFS